MGDGADGAATLATRRLPGWLRWATNNELAALITIAAAVWGVVEKGYVVVDFYRGTPAAIPGSVLVVVAAAEYVIWRRVRRGNTQTDAVFWVAILASTTVVATTVLVSVPIAALQPSWCPGWLCPPPAATGSFDSNLEARFAGFHTQAVVVAGGGDPDWASQSPSDQAGSVNAELITDAPGTLGVLIHLRDMSTLPLAVQSVGLVVESRTAPPSSVPVWSLDTADFDINGLDVFVDDAATGTTIRATFSDLRPGDTVRIPPGDSDEISLRVHSSHALAMRFTVAIRYRLVGEAGEPLRTLTLQPGFQVTFATQDQWELRNGHNSDGGLAGVGG